MLVIKWHSSNAVGFSRNSPTSSSGFALQCQLQALEVSKILSLEVHSILWSPHVLHTRSTVALFGCMWSGSVDEFDETEHCESQLISLCDWRSLDESLPAILLASETCLLDFFTLQLSYSLWNVFRALPWSTARKLWEALGRFLLQTALSWELWSQKGQLPKLSNLSSVDESNAFDSKKRN